MKSLALKTPMLKILSHAFALTVKTRHWLYKNSLMPSRRVRVPVISVGNITLGGTGKTPLVDLIAKYLIDKNKSVGLVSRGYGAINKSQGVIDRSEKNFSKLALKYGDEPALLQWKNPKLHVSVNSNRFEACQALLDNEKIEIIVADDAFQHLALKRNLDIVLIDATEELESFQLLPLGRMRENFYSLERADLIILNKTNLVSPEKTQKIKKMIFNCVPYLESDTGRWLEARYDFEGFFNLQTERAWDLALNEKVFLVSGLAKNDSFFKMCREKLGETVCGHMGFADHHNYSAGDVDSILSRAKELGADRILITEKDAVKISQWKSEVFVYSKLKMSLIGEGHKLYDKVDQIIS